MKFQHTHGPWEIEVSEEHPNGLIVAPGSEVIVAEIQSNGQNAREVMANARLIKAAPRMLAALQKAERLAWEVGSETEDGVKTILPDERGNLWREISGTLADATWERSEVRR